MPKTKEGYLTAANGAKLAYVKTTGLSPGIIFLGGYMSDMTGIKAQALENFCKRTNRSFIRFDYQGHGASTGSFELGTISTWTLDVLEIIDSLSSGPQILVGSSMGGWIMLLAALQRKLLVSGLIGIAAATDFTKRLREKELTASQLLELEQTGLTHIESPYSEAPYIFTKTLLEDGQTRLLLDKPINLDCPVRLIHGMKDTSVPWQNSLKLAETLRSPDIEVTLIKNGDHRLSDPAAIDKMLQAIESIISR